MDMQTHPCNAGLPIASTAKRSLVQTQTELRQKHRWSRPELRVSWPVCSVHPRKHQAVKSRAAHSGFPTGTCDSQEGRGDPNRERAIRCPLPCLKALAHALRCPVCGCSMRTRTGEARSETAIVSPTEMPWTLAVPLSSSRTLDTCTAICTSDCAVNVCTEARLGSAI